MDDGIEVRLYDRKREPPEWTGMVLGTQCVVFLSDVSTSEPLSREGKPFASVAEATCVVFESLDAAQRFCESTVDGQPNVCCEVFDGQGIILRCWWSFIRASSGSTTREPPGPSTGG